MTNPTKVVPLERLESAINMLREQPENCLGSVSDTDEQQGWWIRDELIDSLCKVRKAIAAPPASILDDLEGLQSGWKEPQEGVYPEGAMLIQVDLASGRTDTAFVYLDDDGYTLRYADDYGDVWTAFEWEDVSRYMLLADIERQASDLNAIIEKHRSEG